jgi:hypothetical protein
MTGATHNRVNDAAWWPLGKVVFQENQVWSLGALTMLTNRGVNGLT